MKKIFAVFFVFLLVFFSFLRYSSSQRDSALTEVVFFDVGQGDAALIQSPFNQDILIDGGPGKIILEKLGQRMGMFNKDLEIVFLTHNHSDHLDGILEAVKSGYKIKAFVYANDICQGADCDELFAFARKNIPKVIQAEIGMKFDLFCNESDADCYWIKILGPEEKFRQDKNLNNSSIILKAHLSQGDFLFTGDAENKVWNYIIANGEEDELSRICEIFNADILKAPHHGSKTGISEELLKLTTPKEAVVSCGKDNKFGHPHPSALKLLDSFGAIIRRTDLDGDIGY
ncbi:MAG: MBL fold metallo-hydrolase [bacterium]